MKPIFGRILLHGTSNNGGYEWPSTSPHKTVPHLQNKNVFWHHRLDHPSLLKSCKLLFTIDWSMHGIITEMNKGCMKA